MNETRVGASPLKVLVVDDDLLIQMATIDMIAEMGHAVYAAASAQEALDKVLDGEGVDLVITDHAMPGMTGLELARKLRESRPDLPVMLATGFDEIPGNEPGENWPRLRKPFQPDELAALMGRLCGA
ncbi:MAG: response regulator [Salinarimonas sp.]|nr:response regulator [Salinarimonas sp.]